MRFTLRQLQLFVAACEMESVTLAAEREHISQSAASSAIAQLERALGVQLLIRRHAQGVFPTPAGNLFLHRARLLLRDAGELERLGDELQETVAGNLDLGSLVTLAPVVTPSLCRAFRERFPEAEFRIEQAGQDGLLRALREGRISLALTYDLGLDDAIAFQSLASLPPQALLPADHPLAGRTEVELGELTAEPMVLLDLPLSRDYFRGLFLAQGLEPMVRHRSRHPDAVRSLVANGFGYSLVNVRPRSEWALDGRPVVTVPLAGAHRPMLLGLAALAGTRETRLVTAFREHCAEHVSDDRIPGMR